MGCLDPIIPAIPALALGLSIITILSEKPMRRFLTIASVILFIFALGMTFYSISWRSELLMALPLPAVIVQKGLVGTIDEKNAKTAEVKEKLLFLMPGNNVESESLPEEVMRLRKSLELLFQDFTQRGCDIQEIRALPQTNGRVVLNDKMKMLSSMNIDAVLCSSLPFRGELINKISGGLEQINTAGINRIRFIPSETYTDHPIVVDAPCEKLIEQLEELEKAT